RSPPPSPTRRSSDLMEQNRSRDWVITRLAVRTAGARLARRRGQLFQVSWNEVDGLAIADKQQSTETLLSMLSDLRAADVASALQDRKSTRLNSSHVA